MDIKTSMLVTFSPELGIKCDPFRTGIRARQWAYLFRFSGDCICVFITCTYYPPSCSISTSTKVGHFNPDVDIQVSKPEGVERVEDRKRIDTQDRNHNNTIFNDGRATGDILAGQIYCPSQATALVPYFMSALDDPEWKWGIFDSLYPYSYIPGLREIGHWPLNTWGNLFPRNGWTTQNSPPKAAAVTAQRIGNIITQVGEPHLYIPLTGEADNGSYVVWEPGELLENTNFGGYFQPVSPVVEPTCVVFGVNDTVSVNDWGGGRVAADGTYAHILWRPYECCSRAGQTFLFAIDFIPYPN